MPTPAYRTYTQPLHRVLRDNWMTNGDVAEALGVSRRSVGLWCQGRGQPHLRNCRRLVAYLSERLGREVTLDELFVNEETAPEGTVSHNPTNQQTPGVRANTNLHLRREDAP